MDELGLGARLRYILQFFGNKQKHPRYAAEAGFLETRFLLTGDTVELQLIGNAHHTMQRSITIAAIALATVAAAAAVWFWALRPLGFASYLSSTGASEADTIRQYWPQRLVQPEWVSATPDRLINWHFAEMWTRLAVVAVTCSVTVGGFLYEVIRRRRLRSTSRRNQPPFGPQGASKRRRMALSIQLNGDGPSRLPSARLVAAVLRFGR